MTTYTTPVAKIAGDPVTFEEWNAANDNPLAIAEGDPTAPAISPAALRWKKEEVYYDSSTGGNITANGSGSFDWTCPAGVTAVLVEAIGGGGGGGGGDPDGSGTGGDGVDGGDTTFDSDVIGSGGKGGKGGIGSTPGNGGNGGAISGDADTGVAGGNGSAGTNSPIAGGAGGILEFDFRHLDGAETTSGMVAAKGAPEWATGGAGGWGESNTGQGGGGGAGSWGRKVFAVTPTNSYAIQIGKGGNGGSGETTVGSGGTHRTGGDAAAPDASHSGGGGGGGAGVLVIWYRKV